VLRSPCSAEAKMYIDDVDVNIMGIEWLCKSQIPWSSLRSKPWLG
jgi:hypothetical protein